MPEHLRETLQDLHEELSSTENLDPETRALLRDAMEEIVAKLASGTTPEPGVARSFSERLRSSARRFQTTHPDLVRAVGRVANALSNVGL